MKTKKSDFNDYLWLALFEVCEIVRQSPVEAGYLRHHASKALKKIASFKGIVDKGENKNPLIIAITVLAVNHLKPQDSLAFLQNISVIEKAWEFFQEEEK